MSFSNVVAIIVLFILHSLGFNSCLGLDCVHITNFRIIIMISHTHTRGDVVTFAFCVSSLLSVY